MNRQLENAEYESETETPIRRGWPLVAIIMRLHETEIQLIGLFNQMVHHFLPFPQQLLQHKCQISSSENMEPIRCVGPVIISNFLLLGSDLPMDSFK